MQHQLYSACGLDIVLHFSASSDNVLKRASQSGTYMYMYMYMYMYIHTAF